MVWVYQRVTYPKLSQTKANKKKKNKNQHHVDCTGSGSKHCNRLLRGRRWYIFLQAACRSCSLPRWSSWLQAIAQPHRQGSSSRHHRHPWQQQRCHRALSQLPGPTLSHTRGVTRGEFVPPAHPGEPLLEQTVETLCSVSCLCSPQHRALTHFIYNKCRSQ